MRDSAFLLSTAFLVTAVAFAAPSADNDILASAHRQQLEFRAGNYAVAKPLVTTLEAAVAKSPNNAKLWEALGGAYMSLQGSMYAGQPDFPAMIAVAERARDAFARSLALDANSPISLASHGMSQMVVAQLKGDGPGVMAGVEEMNAAVRKYPRSPATRLTRAFTIIHLPPAMRDTNAVTEDLKFIQDIAPGGRPADVLHVLLGDVYAEMGNLESARGEYALVTGASAFAAEQAKARQKGPITPESISQVRMVTGAGCAACHAPGTDN
jgi:hypothetical protein